MDKPLPPWPSIATIEVDRREIHEKLRILFLPPEVKGDDPKVSRQVAGQIAGAIRADRRAVPYRPSDSGQAEAAINPSRGSTSCAEDWLILE